MGRAFEYRKAAKLKRWGHMAKTFTRLGKQIAIAVKAGGPDPDTNSTLRGVIATCKRENMPKDNIERAIKNALGKDTSDYKGMTYEGYGPHGIAIFVDTLTDNTTRTVADVRSIFNKFGGNLGTTGSLAFLFDHKCVFTFKKKDGIDMDELILDLIDFNVEDEYDEDPEEGTITIYGDPKSYAAIQKYLEEAGFEEVGGDFTYIPNDTKDVTPEQRETIDKMVERLEEVLMDIQKADNEWNIVLLRYFNPIGAHKSGTIGENPNGIPNNLMPYITQTAVGKRAELGVFGDDYDTHDGTGVRDYIHVVDLARAHVAALKAIVENKGIAIYNIGTGHGYSVLDVVKAFEKANGVPVPYSIKPRRPGDIATCYCNPAKAEAELGWKAEFGIEEMCRDSWNWQKNNPNGFEE